MGKRASDRAGKCKACNKTFNQGDQINLGKKPDGQWAVCADDKCYKDQIDGKVGQINKPTPQPKPDQTTLNDSINKSSTDCAADVMAFHNTVGTYAWEKIEELIGKNGDLTQKIISWEGLLKVYAMVWSRKSLD